MPMFVTALFEGADEANRAIKALHDAGFVGSNIQHIDRKREEQGFFDRLFIDENGDSKKPPGRGKGISLMGIERDEVDFYAQLVRQGYSLVIVLCSNQRLDEVRDLLEQFAIIDPDEILLSQRLDDGEEEYGEAEEHRPRLESGAPTGTWFDVVEVKDEEWTQREGAKAHAVHVRPKRHIHHLDVSQLPGAELSHTFQRLQPEFQRHFRENYGDRDLSYKGLRLAYRYGVRLAENPRFRHSDWSQIEPIAHRNWTDNGASPWRVAGPAVRHAWETVRGGESEQPRA